VNRVAKQAKDIPELKDYLADEPVCSSFGSGETEAEAFEALKKKVAEIKTYLR